MGLGNRQEESLGPVRSVKHLEGGPAHEVKALREKSLLAKKSTGGKEE